MANHRTINYDVPNHKCPVCNHTCQLTRRPEHRATGNPKGRPPIEMTNFIRVLQEVSDQGGTLTQKEMAERFGLALVSVSQYLCRARKRGVDIRRERFGGYWIAPSKEEHAQNSLTNETTSTEMSGPKSS